MPETAGKLTFQPVTKARWDDFAALFGSKGAPSYCWCMSWRTTPEEARQHSGAERRPMMEARVKRGTSVGLLGYRNDEPIAWVSIAPRDTYRDLGGPDATDGEEIWSLACMFVRREHRGEGLSRQLIDAASAYAKTHGATAVEAYPVDPDSPSYRFMGFVPAFERLGFTEVARTGARRHVMRLSLAR